MNTEEERAFTQLLNENLDVEDFSGTSTPEIKQAPVPRHFRHRNKRWRRLNLKIKLFTGAAILCTAMTCALLYSSTRNPDMFPASSKVQKNISATPASCTSAKTGSVSRISDSNQQELPETTKTPAPSASPAPTPAPTVTPKPSSITNDWNMILVNPWNPISEDFTVELETIENGHSVDARIAKYLKRMLEDARAAGLSPMICSSYRTNEKQQTLYTNKINYYLSQGYSQADAESEAGKWIAVPGTSEHQTGLAVDIVSSSYQLLDQKQEETAEQKWLMENSYKYGFILRYPNAKKEITGIYYEPWHYRYVGYKTAKEIYEKDICYEEYLEELGE